MFFALGFFFLGRLGLDRFQAGWQGRQAGKGERGKTAAIGIHFILSTYLHTYLAPYLRRHIV